MATLFGVELVQFFVNGDEGVCGVSADGTCFFLENEQPCESDNYIALTFACDKPEWEETDEDIFNEWKNKLIINL